MLAYNDRFKDAPWYKPQTKPNILLVGAGGIGSNALYNLSKTIPAVYYIIDSDKVTEYNVGCQFFSKEQVGRYKAEALKLTLTKVSHESIFNVITSLYTTQYLPIMIMAVDNMLARTQAFNIWKQKSDREIFIDGRLRANLYELYVVTPGMEEAYEKTLFEDSAVDDGPCTFKQTAYFGMLIGARITHVLVNYLTNKYSTEPICNIPFRIAEYGEPFLIDIT